MNNIGCCVVQPCWRCLPQWQHKGLCGMHLLRWRSQRDQFYYRCYGASLLWREIAIGTIDLIASALVPSQLLKVVAQSPIMARGLSLPCMAYMANCPSGKRLIIVLHNIRSQLPLWQGSHCCTQPSRHPWQGVCCCLLWWEACYGPPQLMHPPWRTHHTRPWQHTRCLWHTQCTCLWQHVHLFQRTRRTRPWRTHAVGYCVAWYGRCCILRTTTWKFDSCMGVCPRPTTLLYAPWV